MTVTSIQEEIETLLVAGDPAIEVLRVDIVGGNIARVFIDYPDGVTLDVCTRATEFLAPIREQYALEVSSPGSKRPLTRPAHYERFVGRRARIVLNEARDERISWTGEIIASDEAGVTLGTDTGMLTVTWAEIKQSNLTGE
jgi:ribosome maturation factor RimP